MSQHPEVRWTERQDKVYLIVMLTDAKYMNVDLHSDSVLTFSRSAGADNKSYELKLELFAEVAVEESVNIGVKKIFCILKKAEKKWWNKLLRGNTPHYVKFDWDKWLDGDEGPADEDTGVLEFSKFGGMDGGLGAYSGNMGSGSSIMDGGKEQEYNPSDWPDTIDSDNGFDIDGLNLEGIDIIGEFSTETLDLGADSWNMVSGSGSMGGGKEPGYNPSFLPDMIDSESDFDIDGIDIIGEFSTETLNLGADSWNMGSGSGSMGGGKEPGYNPSFLPDMIDSENDFDIDSFNFEGIDIIGELSTENLNLGADSGNMDSGSSSMGGGKEQEDYPSDPDMIDLDNCFDIQWVSTLRVSTFKVSAE